MNFEKQKTYPPPNMNSDGIMLNYFATFLFSYFNLNKFSYETDISWSLEKVLFIENSFTNRPEFKKYEKILKSENKELKLQFQDDYLPDTVLFLLTHFSLRLTVDGLIKLNKNLVQAIQTIGMNPNNPEFKKTVTGFNTLYSYLKNKKLTTYLMKFLEISVLYCVTKHNEKYNKGKFLEKGASHFSSFSSDFYHYLSDSCNDEFNELNELIFYNIVKVVRLLRETNPDVFAKNMESTKLLVYFSLIYSSRPNLISNPYIRTECFEIIEYLFINNEGSKEKNQLLGIFKDNLVREIFIYSIIRVFIDSERLGGNNQFFEKFNVRHKQLLLIDSIKNQLDIDDQLIYYAKNYKDDCILMVNYLINDLTYMGDETIDRLKSIKEYENLKDDIESYNLLNEEQKKMKEDKFNEDSQRCKGSLPLFKRYLKFLVLIIDTCQSIILEYKLGQKLANLLNYLLDMFASKTGNVLKVKNMKQYDFDPKDFLSFIIQAYAGFANQKEFITNIVSDERSFKSENFQRAYNLSSKIKLSLDKAESFYKIINLINAEKDILINTIDYSDAPEEFIDQISAELMTDPVKLPTSGQILDRSTIEQHLLSDPKDPFNRKPLTKNDLIPDLELKQRIEDYKKSKEIK